MDTLEQLNDQLRQQAHAGKVASSRAMQRLSPEERQQADLDNKIQRMVEQAIMTAFQGVTIQAGAGIVVSGTWPNLTIAATPLQPRAVTGTAICNSDGTITINIQA